jgi:hypothetical protein
MRVLRSLLLFLLIFSPALQAQWFDLTTGGIPRNADGSVDMNAPIPRDSEGDISFSGVWSVADASGSIFDESNISGWAIDAKLEAEATFYTQDPRFHCLPAGPSGYLAGSRRMVQNSDYIAILNGDMTYRQVWMDGRELEDTILLPTWMGYSIGYWEGDDLIIESNGYNTRTWLTRNGLPHTDQLHIVERYIRHSYGRTTLEITYNDPDVFIEPVQATVNLVLRPDSFMQEIICNESDTGQRHYTGEMNQAVQKIVDVPLEILESYTGIYEGPWLGNMIRAEVYMQDSELWLKRTPRYSTTGGNIEYDTSVLVAQSQNAFDSDYGLGWVFNSDDDGNIISVSEVHVSGAWSFEKVE